MVHDSSILFPEKTARQGRGRQWGCRVFRILASLLTLFVFLFAGLFTLPKLFGIEPFVVMSGSMEPAIRRHCLCRHEGRRHSGGRHHCLPGFFRRGRGRDHHPSRRKEGEGGLGHKGRCKPHRGCGCCPSRPARRALSLLDSKAGRPSWWAGERDGTSSHPLGSCGKPPLGGCRCALRRGGEGREKAVF